MVWVSTSYSTPIIFWVNQMFSSAYTASTPPWPLAATKVRYSAAEERAREPSGFLADWGGLLGVMLYLADVAELAKSASSCGLLVIGSICLIMVI